MCRATTTLSHHAAAGGVLSIRAFYLRLSSSPANTTPPDLSIVYLPAIGGAALHLNGHALPLAAPAEVKLRQVPGDSAAAYASADRVAAAEGARFEVYAAGKKELVAEGAFVRRPGAGWRVECHRHGATTAVAVKEVVVLAEDGAVMRAKARAARRGVGCGATRLEWIPEEGTTAGDGCECGTCPPRGQEDDDEEDWDLLGDEIDGDACKQDEEETVRWAMEVGVWAVCLGVGLLATARRFRRKRVLFW